MMELKPLPKQLNGAVDWAEARRQIEKIPPPQTQEELAAELRSMHAKELQRIQAMGADAPRIIQQEREAAASAYRRQQEIEGRLRTAAESKRLADALAEKAAEARSVTPEIYLRQAEARARYDEAMRLSAERLKAPIPEAELQAAYERKTELLERYNRARAESLKPDVDLGKF